VSGESSSITVTRQLSRRRVLEALLHKKGSDIVGDSFKALLHELSPEGRLVLGVDLRGAKLTVAIADISNKVLAEATEPNPRGRLIVITRLPAGNRNLKDEPMMLELRWKLESTKN
jgi:hypothetical protein